MNKINKIPLLLILVLGMVIVGIVVPANATYEAKNFDSLLGTKGLSDQLLKNHFTTYHSYVSDTNNVSNKLDTMLKAEKTDTHKYLELKRMFGLKWNGMRLHEYYFENLVKGGKPIDTNSALYQTIVDDFGSYENWEKDFRAVSAIRDDGWSILYYDSMYNRLFNVWIDENDVGHLSGTVPILVMDGFAHAYKLDYGNNKADYINAFIDATDWTVVNSRFEKAC